MFVIENLLRNEYFPKELPPCFHSENFADNHSQIQEYIYSNEPLPSEPLIFSGYKNTNARRKFAIPNPINYAYAANTIVSSSSEIFEIYEKVDTSLTVPLRELPKKNECYRKNTYEIKDSKEKIKKLYQNNLYEIRLDIQAFFDSIYTHSVSWAMHTKNIAKKNKINKNLVGNLLDSSLQKLNGGQTNGILVGNAVSRIISEIILCSVDIEIKKKLKEVNYLRYVDDYYIFVKDSSKIDNIIAIFRQELAKFELILNENKLRINESPFLYGNSWVEQMQAYARLEPQILLEKAIIEYHNYKDVTILKYALKVLENFSFSEFEWSSIQPILFNIWIRFPNLSKIISVIFFNNKKNLSISLLKKSIYSILDTHITLRNDEEIIWCLWISKIFKIRLSQEYIRKILNTENWLAIIILLDMIDSRKSETYIVKLIDKFRDRIIEEYFSELNLKDGMLTDIWLLAYESDKNKWLNTSGEKNFTYARKHPFFKKLYDINVDFYNNNFTYELEKSNVYANYKEIFKLLKQLTPPEKPEKTNLIELQEFLDKDTLYNKAISNLFMGENY